MPAKFLAPAGGDSRHVAVICQKLLHLGQRRRRLGQPIQPEFKELRVAQRRLSPLHQFRRRTGLNGHAQLAHAQPQAGRRGSGNSRNGSTESHSCQLTHLKGVLASMQQRIWAADYFFGFLSLLAVRRGLTPKEQTPSNCAKFQADKPETRPLWHPRTWEEFIHHACSEPCHCCPYHRKSRLGGGRSRVCRGALRLGWRTAGGAPGGVGRFTGGQGAAHAG